MSDRPIEERLAAVERALIDTPTEERPRTPSGDVAALEERLDDLEADVAELEAAVQAVRGYVGNVRAVNDEVEQRAEAALAKAESVERRLATDHEGYQAPDAGPEATARGEQRHLDVDTDVEASEVGCARFEADEAADPGLLARIREVL